jgi:hypothetical protein
MFIVLQKHRLSRNFYRECAIDTEQIWCIMEFLTIAPAARSFSGPNKRPIICLVVENT